MAACITDQDCPPGEMCESITGQCVSINPQPLPPGPSAGCTQDDVSRTKTVSAVVAAVAFGVVSSPMMYRLTNQIFSSLGLPTSDSDGCPTVAGLLIHGLAFTAILRVAMDHLPKCDPKPGSSRDKWITAAMGGALFILVSSPFAYGITNSLITAVAGSNNNIADSDGCPKTVGLLIHSAIFGVIVRLMMRGQ